MLLLSVQVVIGGRNKYLINGHAAQEKWVLSQISLPGLHFASRAVLSNVTQSNGLTKIPKGNLTCKIDPFDPQPVPCGEADTLARRHSLEGGLILAGSEESVLPCVHCSRVTDLFHSVQLNVNNPHFLIMQGKITQVRDVQGYGASHGSGACLQ